MNTNTYELFIKRVNNLINSRENEITPYRISKNSGMNPSTLNNILNGTFKDPKLSTIARICNGLEINLKDFFDDDLFEL